MIASYTSSGVTVIGVGFELTAIAAVVLGGTLLTGGAGTVVGTLVGVLLLQVIANIINQVGACPAPGRRWCRAASCSSWWWLSAT
jgi:ribose transport system permease protein